MHSRTTTSSQTPGLSPSASIRSPEDTGLSPRTPIDFRRSKQLQVSQALDWQSYEAKKFDKQDTASPPTSIESLSESRNPQKSFPSATFASKSGSSSGFLRSSPKSLSCSPPRSVGLPSPASELGDRPVSYRQQGFSTLPTQFGQEIIHQADHPTDQSAQVRKQQCGKSKDSFLCAY